MAVTHYRELLVWQKAMDFAVACYKATEGFPKTQTYSLSNQLQRATVSVPSNIAEGQGRGSTKDFLRHLSIANGSLFEAETQIILASRLGFLAEDHARGLLATAAEIGRMLNGLMTSLHRRLAGDQG